MKDKVVIIVGPTASGKTSLAVELARAVGGEVISADSRQVYRGLDLGTGKVTKREMRGVRHHLIDIASPKRVYTADDFVRDGRYAIADIVSRGKVPIIAGGTGFYIDALIGAISLANVDPNPTLRRELAKHAAPELYEMLLAKDPDRAATIDRHNPVRLIRALEVAEALGASPAPKTDILYDALWIGIDIDKEVLNQKIETRLCDRIKRGMLAEAKRLHSEGLSWKRMEELGLEYRYMARLLTEKISKEEFVRDLATEIRRYAKRQRMYWRRNKDIMWFTPLNLKKSITLAATFLHSD